MARSDARLIAEINASLGEAIGYVTSIKAENAQLKEDREAMRKRIADLEKQLADVYGKIAFMAGSKETQVAGPLTWPIDITTTTAQ
jgi:hypothetical protein